MARLKTPVLSVSVALNVRTEGLGLRATGRCFGKSYRTITRWETWLSVQVQYWSHPAPTAAEVTLAGEEVYTRVDENRLPQ